MTYYEDVINAMPLRQEITTTEIALLTLKLRGEEYHSWTWMDTLTRVREALVKGTKNGTVTKVGMVQDPATNRWVMTWIREG